MPVQRISGFCALCRSRCGCISVIDDGRLVAVEPDPSHPTGRHLCIKGKAAPELVHHPDRLRFPLRRTRPKGDGDPGWQRISWDEALAWTVHRMQAIAAASGPEAVAFAITTPSGTAMADGISWVERLVRAWGSPNIVYATEICNWHKDYATAYTFGSGIGAPDFAQTGCVLLWGHNPAATWLSQATAIADAHARGAALVVVDPRRAGLAARADEWLRVRPGSDGALALSIAHVLLREGWYDDAFVRAWSNGPLLVRDDTGRFLRAADLGPHQIPGGYVVWDADGARPVVYDATTGRYEEPLGTPLLDDAVVVATVGGPLRCRPAFMRYRELCAAYPPERAAQITGVPAAQIVATARLLWERRPVCYYAWSGVGQHTNATQTDRAITLLYALLGSWDAPGGNVQWARPLTNDIAGKELLRPAQRDKALGLPARPLGPPRDGWVTTRDLYRAVLHSEPYAVRGVIGFGANLLLSQPDTAVAQDALQSLDLFVQCDLFLTPTAAQADLILPVASAWEREGLRVGFGISQEAEALIQLRPAMVAPQGEARADAQIACDLALRLGLGAQFFNGDIDAGHRHVLAPSGITLEQLRAQPQGVRIALAPRYRRYAEPDSQGVTGFPTPSRRVEIYSETFLDHGYDPLPTYVEPTRSPQSRPDLAARYPLVLTSAKVLQFCHSQHRALPKLRRQVPDPQVELHPSTAAARGIAAGDWVAIETPEGAMRARAKLNNSLARDVICAQFGWWQACTALDAPAYPADGIQSANYNHLVTSDDHDPISGSLPLRSSLCQVRRLGDV
jgi:anaerobic selenocysteine-containing dehydrogenase